MEDEERKDPTSVHFVMIVEAHRRTEGTRNRIAAGLAKYQTLIDAIGNGTESGIGGRGTVASLSKHQTDLVDDFSQFSSYMRKV